MAKITLPQRKKHKSGYNRKDVRDAYNLYRPVRLAYLAAHPICEDCQNDKIVNANGKVESRITAAVEVHHIRPISTGKTAQEIKALATDYNNLKALCAWHHLYEHGKAIDKRFI